MPTRPSPRLTPATPQIQTGLDVLGLRFLPNHTINPNHKILHKVNTAVGVKIGKRSRRYAKKVMAKVYLELSERPRTGQFGPPLPRSSSVLHRATAFAAIIPSSYFQLEGSNQDCFLKGLGKFLGTKRASTTEDVARLPFEPRTTSDILQESDVSTIPPSIEKEVINLDSGISSESSEDSDSDVDATPLPLRSTTGKQRALSTPSEDKSSSPPESEPSSTLPRRIVFEKQPPRPRTVEKFIEREGVETGTTDVHVNHAKKRIRDSGPYTDLLPAKRPALQLTEQTDERDSHPEGSPEPVEPIPKRPTLKKRNPHLLVNENLQADIKFYKAMFLYGGGISEPDLLAYKMRVQNMGQTHRHAWDVMTGKKNADHAARKASSGSSVGTNTSQL